MLGCLLCPCGSHIVGDTQVATPCDADSLFPPWSRPNQVRHRSKRQFSLPNNLFLSTLILSRRAKTKDLDTEAAIGSMKEARLRAVREREWRRELMSTAIRSTISAHELPFLSKLVLFSSLFKMSLTWTKVRGLKITNINQVSHQLPECLSSKNCGDNAYKALTCCKGPFCFHVPKHLLLVTNEPLPLLLCPPKCSSLISAHPTMFGIQSCLHCCLLPFRTHFQDNIPYFLPIQAKSNQTPQFCS